MLYKKIQVRDCRITCESMHPGVWREELEERLANLLNLLTDVKVWICLWIQATSVFRGTGFWKCFNDYIHWCETHDSSNNIQVTPALFKVLNESKWEKVRFKKQNKIIHCSAILFILLLKKYKNVMCVDQSHPWKLVVCLSSAAFPPTLDGANSPFWVLPQVSVLIFGSTNVLLPVVILCYSE